MRRAVLASVGIVVLLLVAGVAAYWALEPQRTASSPSAPTLFSYEQTGAYTYVAHLRNNTLYGSTNLTPGNGTLFTAITTWVNLTFVYRLAAATRFDALSEVHLAVVLQSPEWSKVLEDQEANVSVSGGPSVSATLSVDLNVSNVTSLASEIGKQTDYQPSSYQVALEPTINTIVQYANLSEGASLAPTLLLNFSSAEIVASHLFVNQPGNFLGAADPPGPSDRGLLPFLVLAVAAVGALFLGLLAYGGARPRDGPDLATLTRPYAEAIVETPSAPPAGPTVPVRTWEDLVKVADTLGCPILRTVPPGSAASSAAPVHFYVLADPVTYTYVHAPGGTNAAGRPAGPVTYGVRSPVRVPAAGIPPAARLPSISSSVRPPSPAGRVASRAAAAVPPPTLAAPTKASLPAPVPWDLSAFLARADQVRAAARALPPSTASALAIEEAPDAMLARAVLLARQGQLPAARAILRRLGQELSGEPRPTPRAPPSWDRSGGASPAPRRPA
jgi:hypothetical protein